MAATPEQIEQLLSDYRNRGEMTRRGFSESRGMSLSMLDYYLRRYGKERKSEAVKLVRAEVEPEPSAAGTFFIVLQNGRRIESGWNFAEVELMRLIRLVEGA